MAILSNRLEAAEYAENFSDIHTPFESLDAALVEANRCLFCYDAPCTKRCPTSINIPKFIKQITTENIKGSAHTILDANIMGAGCSKVCPVEKLCEGSCVYNLKEEKPISIAKLQRFSTDAALQNKWPLFTRKPTIGKKVAVIGAGPAGLSCAHQLSRNGVDVTIYEKEKQGGGLMTYGIAAYKVTPEFCKEEVDYITSLGGITIRFGEALGRHLKLEQLLEQYDAVYLGFGVGVARPLNIEGENLHGVEDAIDFIYRLRSNALSTIPVGDKVAVIGLGMTAIDAATQASRLGAKEVTLIYRRSFNEKGCTDVELSLAKQDGCTILWLAAPKEIRGIDGKVQQLICSKMELGQPDASGRAAPVETGETFALQVDMIIKSTGQEPYSELLEQLGIKTHYGRITIDNKGATNIAGVFAGGDNVNGGKEVVDAVQAGKVGAKAILEYMGVE